MTGNILINILKNQFLESLILLEKIIDKCPNDLWNYNKSDFIFWEKIDILFSGIDIWINDESIQSLEPFLYKNKSEIKWLKSPIYRTQNDLKIRVSYINKKVNTFFDHKNDDWLSLISKLHNEKTNIEIIIFQIRNIMYQIGQCEAILREYDRNIIKHKFNT